MKDDICTRQYICPVDTALGVISGKWKPRILWKLYFGKVMRYSEIRRAMPSITEKMLAQQLRELEQDQLIRRKIYPVMPPKVEYSFTEFGTSLWPVIQALEKWGRENETRIRAIVSQPQTESAEAQLA
jgi:DNA-binding HxlR family transcriptional regulator